MVDVEHLLAALLRQEEGLLPRLFNKMDVPVEPFAAAVERELEGRPQVGGPGAEPGKVYLSQRLSELLVRAEDEARQMKDEYVSVEHLVLAMIDEGARGVAARIFREFRVTRDRFLKALSEVRGSQRIAERHARGHLRGPRAVRARPGEGGPRGPP